MVLRKCDKCGKEFDSNNQFFCSSNCEKAFEDEIQERLKIAVENDPGHTKKLSN